jgi:hypothetical protein
MTQFPEKYQREIDSCNFSTGDIKKILGVNWADPQIIQEIESVFSLYPETDYKNLSVHDQYMFMVLTNRISSPF